MKRLILLPVFLFLCTCAVRSQGLQPVRYVPMGVQIALVLEYESPEALPLGKDIARLVAQSIAKSQTSVGRIDVLYPTKPEEQVSYDVDNINRHAEQKGAHSVIWGEYYVAGDSIIVYSHMRVISGNSFGAKELGLTVQTESGLVEAVPPTMQVNFRPVGFHRSAFDAISKDAGGGIPLISEAMQGAAPAGTLRATDAFSIRGKKDSWVEVRSQDGRAYGWMQQYDAAQQFASLGMWSNCFSLYVGGSYQEAEKALGDYVSTYGNSEDDVNHALAAILAGNSRLRAAGDTVFYGGVDNVSPLYREAGTLLPNNPAPVDYLTAVQLLMFVQAKKNPGGNSAVVQGAIAGVSGAEAQMIETVQESGNMQTIENLAVLYKMAEKEEMLRPAQMDQATYREQINERKEVLEEVKKEQRTVRFGVVERYSYAPDEYGILFGAWLKKGAERGFSFENSQVAYDDAKSAIEQSEVFGVDFHFRSALSRSFFLDYSLGGWYTTLKFTNNEDVPEILDSASARRLSSSDEWAVVVPITFGASLDVLPPLSPVQPHVMAGGGVYVAHRSSAVKRFAALKSDQVFADLDPEETLTDTQVGFGGYGGLGVTFHVSRGFALSLMGKYQFIEFKDDVLANRRDYTGLQISAGIVFKR